jgi:hypothetical protein
VRANRKSCLKPNLTIPSLLDLFFHRNHIMTIFRSQKPSSTSLPTYVLVHYLTWLSIFPLTKIYLKRGSLFVYYFHASSGGSQLISLFRILRLVAQEPERIKDIKYFDSPHVQLWKLRHLAFSSCSAELKRIELIAKTCFPFLGSSEIKFYAVNVRKTWEAWLEPLLLLRRTGKYLAHEKNLPLEQFVLVSPFASLIDFLDLDQTSNEEITVISQPFRNKSLLYSLGASSLSLWRLVRKCASLLKVSAFSTPGSKESPNVGIEASWNLSSQDQPNEMMLDDLFWWRESSIPPERVRYFYDRITPQPTADRLKKTNALGIQSILLNSQFCGDAPELFLKTPEPHKNVMNLFYDLWFSGRLLYRALFSNTVNRSIISIIHWFYIKSEGLADIYKHLGIRALFYVNEGNFDVFSLAAKSADAIRIGHQFTCLPGIDTVSARSHDVFFFWGQHDMQVALDSGCVSKHMLISGCFLSSRSNPQSVDDAQSVVNGFRKLGVDYVLTIFDNSGPTPNFYRFLFEWLTEDPKLGLLIKSKGGKTWSHLAEGNNSFDHSLEQIMQLALNTRRIHLMSPYVSPGDVALVSDFTLGVGTFSATALAALQGARVFYLDYERLDQSPQSAYSIFHSLGPDRCVFYDLRSLKQAIINYSTNPKDNPHLGDASPILQRLDPFGDSGASRRIAEYVEWYLKGLDQGLDKDQATLTATKKYAEKWGKDKVVRGL